MKNITLRLAALLLLAATTFSTTALFSSVFVHVPETVEQNYQIIYELNIPRNGQFRNSSPVPYSIDNSATAPEFDRIAYYLQLTDGTGTRWVYVSMDAFTDNAAEIGLPHNVDNPVVHQGPVSNLNIASNVTGVVTGTFLDSGHIEMWPSDYCSDDEYGVLASDNDLYDWGDCGASTGSGYGSFQVHNPVARQTVFAYNRWGRGDDVDDDLGIGNFPGANPDWTFAANTGTYTARKLVVLVRPRTFDVQFTELPRNRQLYSRNLETNLATVSIAGEERFGGYTGIVLRRYRNGHLQSQTSQPLTYTSGRAPFSFQSEIPAELAHYEFELLLDDGNTLKKVKRVYDVVAGDAYLVYGQSNAEAIDWDPDRSANEYASQWLLTFGQNGDDGTRAKNILVWLQAEGDSFRDGPGAIGQWPMVFGRQIIDTHEIPVAILNGSRSGHGIRRLQKDRDDPDNLYDTAHDDTRRPYNRLRYRAIQAGVADTVRAMLYYQGEGDNEKADRHAEGYQGLREDWAVDYPNIERFYVTQIRPGCGVTASNVALRNTQRKFVDWYPKTSVMVTNGLDNHDGCHFLFTDGYEDLGWHFFGVISRDLYNGPDGPDIDPINPAFVRFTDEDRDELQIVLRDPATLSFPLEALDDFHLVDSPATITGRTVDGNTIKLQLSEPVPYGTVLEYHSHLEEGAWVTNANGLGLLTFAEPVTAISIGPDGSRLSGVDLTRISDGSEAATLRVQLRDEHGENLHIPGVSIVFETDLGNFPNGRQTSNPVLTNSDGWAEITLTSTAAGQATVFATANGASVGSGSPVAVTFLPGPISFAGNGTQLSGENLTPVANGTDGATVHVQLRDALGNPLPQAGVVVDLIATHGQFAGGGATIAVSTGASGLATATLHAVVAGPSQVTAAIDSQSVTNGSPLPIAFVPGPLSFGESGTFLKGINLMPVADGSDPAIITVQLRDDFGNDIIQAGVMVEFSTTLGHIIGGNSTASFATNAAGLATAVVTSTVAGEANITASIDGQAVTNGAVTIQFRPGPPAQLHIEVQPEGGPNGAPLIVQPVISVRDALGNLVHEDNATVVQVTIVSGSGGSLGGTLAFTANGGLVTFTDLTLTGIAGENFVLEFSDPIGRLASIQSVPIQIIPGAGFTAWAEALPEGERGELDDPGGFGIPNILRYAFGMNPLQPDRGALPRLKWTEDGSESRLQITFIRRVDDPELIYTVEGSVDLVVWSALVDPVLTSAPMDIATETVTVTDTVAPSTMARRFLRISVSLP